MPKISANMQAVVDRLKAGDGTIVPMRGGYWLPGDVANNTPTGEWHSASRREFGCNVGTQTIDGLRERGLLKIVGPSPFDSRRGFSLKVHQLTEQAQ